MNTLHRREFLRTSILAGAASILFPREIIGNVRAIKALSPLKDKKILYVWGGWDGHEPKQSIDVFVPWLRAEGATVIVSDTLDSYLDETLMNSLDLIIQVWTMGKITPEHEKILLNTIKNGCGFTGWHGGVVQFDRYQIFVGCCHCCFVDVIINLFF